MPFFNLRRGAPSAKTPAASTTQSESVEVIRKRARHRLIGAAVLVLIGVVGFPLLFDTQPRPVAVDIPIEIPAKNAVKPLPLPTKPAAAPVAQAPLAAATPAASATASTASASDKVPANSSLASKEEIITSKQATAPVNNAPIAIKTEAEPELKPQSKTEPKTASKLAAKPVAKPVATDDGDRAKALLDGKPAATAPVEVEGRLVVQVGAYADVAKAREARAKLEKAGLKTYTQVAETKDGKRIRVRVGPYASKAEADKAVAKIRSLDLPASILTL